MFLSYALHVEGYASCKKKHICLEACFVMKSRRTLILYHMIRQEERARQESYARFVEESHREELQLARQERDDALLRTAEMTSHVRSVPLYAVNEFSSQFWYRKQ